VTLGLLAGLGLLANGLLLRQRRDVPYLSEGLAGLGLGVLIVGESGVAKKLSARLLEEGIFALPIVYPMVARDRARIRTIMNAALTREDLDFAIGAFGKAGRELHII
jgi:glycine C-acetyltransferase